MMCDCQTWSHPWPHVKLLARTLLCLFVLLGGGRESPAALAPYKIVLAYASMVTRPSLIWIAKDQGFFAKLVINASAALERYTGGFSA